MNVKLKPPCLVRVRGSHKILRLRSLSRPNATLKQQGWTGLVATVQNENGTGLVEYRKLRPV